MIIYLTKGLMLESPDLLKIYIFHVNYVCNNKYNTVFKR